MQEKKPFGTRLEAFFAGKGFYVVLFLCVAVIGVSAWSLLSGGERSGDGELSMSVAKLDESYLPTATPAPKPTAAPKQSPAAPAQETAAEPPAAPAAEAAVVEAPAAAVSAPAEDYFIWPVSGEVCGLYSMTMPVWNPTMQDWRTHDGLDIAAALGTQVKATAGGTVTAVYDDDLGGTTVVIAHRNALESVYANLAATPAVSVGDTVSVGQVIGAVGDSALGEAGQVCHLHFAMLRDGGSVDPTEYLP